MKQLSGAEIFLVCLVIFLFLATFTAGFVAGGSTADKWANRHWQTEAVKHGAARYNPQTAAFEWSNQPREVSGE
jgi:hypothetical protein